MAAATTEEAPTTYTGTARISLVTAALNGCFAIEVDGVDGSDDFNSKVEDKNNYIYVKDGDASTGPAPARVKKAFDVELKATKTYAFKVYESANKLYLYEAPEEQ